MRRRRFIQGALSLPAAALVAGCGGGDDSAPPPAAAPASRGGVGSWPEVRALFELDPEVQHLSAYILAPHSQPVREAIERHRAGLDRDPRRYLVENEALEEEAAEAAARHLGTKADLVALTDSATMGLGLVFGGLRLQEGDEVVTSVHDHFVARTSVAYAAERTGAVGRDIELYARTAPEKATVRSILRAYEEAITPATRVVLVTWVHSSSGCGCRCGRSPRSSSARTAAGPTPSARWWWWMPRTRWAAVRLRWRTWAATSSSPAVTNGCSARAAPASSGRGRPRGSAWHRSSPRSAPRTRTTSPAPS